MSDRELPATVQLRRSLDERATVPLARPRRLSREFLAVGVPLTPERAQLHILDTIPCDYLPAGPDVERTRRIEDRLARKIRQRHVSTRGHGMAFVLLAAASGLGLGFMLTAMVTP